MEAGNFFFATILLRIASNRIVNIYNLATKMQDKMNGASLAGSVFVLRGLRGEEERENDNLKLSALGMLRAAHIL